MEYWYLRWWNPKEESHVYPYRETNHQMYVLKKDYEWKVYINLRPLPTIVLVYFKILALLLRYGFRDIHRNRINALIVITLAINRSCNSRLPGVSVQAVRGTPS